MKKYTLKRILTSLFTLLAILLVLFILMQLMPGSPFNDEKLTPDMRAALYEAEQIVLEQAVIFPLYGQCNAEMISSAVTGVDFHPVALNRVFKDAKKSV